MITSIVFPLCRVQSPGCILRQYLILWKGCLMVHILFREGQDMSVFWEKKRPKQFYDAKLIIWPMEIIFLAFELNRTFWQDFIAFLWFILFTRGNFLITSSILLSWNKKIYHWTTHAYYRICGMIDSNSMLLNFLIDWEEICPKKYYKKEAKCIREA